MNDERYANLKPVQWNIQKAERLLENGMSEVHAALEPLFEYVKEFEGVYAGLEFIRTPNLDSLETELWEMIDNVDGSIE